MRAYDRFVICAAYYIVASRYHSGQASEGYRKLCQVSRLGFRPGLSAENDPEFRSAAAALLWKRRREILRHW